MSTKCHFCKKQVEGFYSTSPDGSIYGHPECFIEKNYNKCYFCEDFIMDENFYEYKGKNLHVICYAE